ncbi:MAG TPA: hemolysin family protein [Thermomicrobiales bacterium]|nr:hemolysin family protein [Thermomicrobiales bacterium]
MSTTAITELIIAIVAIGVVGVSTWAEMSLSAGTRVDIRRLLDNRLSREDALAIERIQRLRSSLLLIEMLASAVAIWMIAVALDELIEDNGLVYGLVVGLAALIIAGNLLPRVFADTEQTSEPSREIRVAKVLSFIFAPIIRPVEMFSNLLTRNKRRSGDGDEADDAATDHNGNNYATGDRERGEAHDIEEDEHEMITGVLHLDEAVARDIMVPRIDIIAIARDVLIAEAVDVAIQHGHSRIPVYGENIDNILGVVYAKDMLRYVNEPHEGMTVEPLVRPAYIVPESKRIDDLLEELQQAKVHLAVVVDEFGGTAGVVTIEDILEEIVGEIQDEYDTETPPFEIVSEREAIVDGRLSIDDLADEMDMVWPEPASGTLGGYIQRRLGRIPAEGEQVELPGIRLTVLLVEHRRVRQVRLERIDTGDGHAMSDGEARPAPVASKF